MPRASPVLREGRPLYEQLAELLASDIRAGRLPVGGRIPSEPELAERYRLGRPTVRQATELLVRQRLVQRRRGSGTYVTEPPGDVPLLSLAGTLEAFGRSGVELTTRLVSPPVRAGRARLPGSPLRGPVLAFTREGRVGGAPVLLEEFELDADTFGGLPAADLGGGSVARLVERSLGLRPDSARQRFAAVAAGGAVARALAVPPGTPLLQVLRALCFGARGELVAVRLHARTDGLQFSQVIERPT